MSDDAVYTKAQILRSIRWLDPEAKKAVKENLGIADTPEEPAKPHGTIVVADGRIYGFIGVSYLWWPWSYMTHGNVLDRAKCEPRGHTWDEVVEKLGNKIYILGVCGSENKGPLK